jgi:small subunit ribosomal protein S6
MRQYEVTFIIDPVLPNEEISGVAKNYQDQLKQENCEIVHVDAMGLKALAFPIKKRSSGIYYCIEFSSPSHEIIEKLELSLRRDERIMRFLTVKLDKYGVKYNQDKRNGLIGKVKKDEKKTRRDDELEDDARSSNYSQRPKPVPVAPKPAAPIAPVAAQEEE